MIRFSTGRTRPSTRRLRTAVWSALMTLSIAIPGVASALADRDHVFDIDPITGAATMTVEDPSGYGAFVSFLSGEVPGTLDIQIESFGPSEGGLVGDILGIQLASDDAFVFDLDASGPDVDRVFDFRDVQKSGPAPEPKPIRVIDFGPGGTFALNGLSETNFTLSDPTGSVSLLALGGVSLSVFLGFDGVDNPDVPGIPFPGDVLVLKPKAKIPVIPEPGTSALMLLGLIGLAATSRRLETQA